jgi:hypothetical protein
MVGVCRGTEELWGTDNASFPYLMIYECSFCENESKFTVRICMCVML